MELYRQYATISLIEFLILEFLHLRPFMRAVSFMRIFEG